MLTLILTAALAAAPNPPTNTLCPVYGTKVGPKSQKVLVRGREYFICCGECAGILTANPDKYLDPTGKPRNAR